MGYPLFVQNKTERERWDRFDKVKRQRLIEGYEEFVEPGAIPTLADLERAYHIGFI